MKNFKIRGLLKLLPDLDYKITNLGYKTPCHIWLRKAVVQGYAQGTYQYKRVRIHKFLWERKYGDIPNNKELDHLCNQKLCINIEHLEIVSHRKNIERSFIRNPRHNINTNVDKTYCKNGHEFTKENTYINSKGHRSCKICRKNTILLRNI